jgi:hypothetical protein
VILEGKKYDHLSSKQTQGTEAAKEDKPRPAREAETAKEKKGPNWAAGSFALNLWRTWRDWWNENG